MSKIRTLILDDEPLDRDIIRSFLITKEDIEIVGECDNGLDGVKLIETLRPDLIFMEVMMPDLTGFEILEQVTDPPAVIFITAYGEYAVKAFEYNTVDYLLKPYSISRFAKAINKARVQLARQRPNEKVISNHQDSGEFLSRLALKNDTGIHIISSDKINILKAQADYVKFYTDEGDFIKHGTMKYFEAHLPPKDFIRIHRSFIVRIREIAKIEQIRKRKYLVVFVVVLQNGQQLPVSQSGYKLLKKVFNLTGMVRPKPPK